MPWVDGHRRRVCWRGRIASMAHEIPRAKVNRRTSIVVWRCCSRHHLWRMVHRCSRPRPFWDGVVISRPWLC